MPGFRTELLAEEVLEGLDARVDVAAERLLRCFNSKPFAAAARFAAEVFPILIDGL